MPPPWSGEWCGAMRGQSIGWAWEMAGVGIHQPCAPPSLDEFVSQISTAQWATTYSLRSLIDLCKWIPTHRHTHTHRVYQYTVYNSIHGTLGALSSSRYCSSIDPVHPRRDINTAQLVTMTTVSLPSPSVDPQKQICCRQLYR